MSTINKILIGVLGLQVLLIVLVRIGDHQPTIGHPEPLLPGLDQDKVSKIEIFDADHTDKPAVALAHKDDKWVVASHYDYPADDTAVKSLLGKLVGMESRGPTTTTRAAQKQLQVADDHYVRKLVLTDTKGETTTVYLGSSPKFHKLTVRIGGHEETHSVPVLTTGDASVQMSSWVDPVYVDIPVDSIESLAVENKNGTIGIDKGEDGGWRLAGADPSSAPLAQDKVKPLLDKVSKIELEEVVGLEAKPEFGFDQPLARITVDQKGTQPPADADAGVSAAEEATIIEIGARKSDRYYLRELGKPYVVTVDAEAVDNLVNLSVDKLEEKPATPEPPTPRP